MQYFLSVRTEKDLSNSCLSIVHRKLLFIFTQIIDLSFLCFHTKSMTTLTVNTISR